MYQLTVLLILKVRFEFRVNTMKQMFARRAKNVLYYNNVVMDELGAECIAAECIAAECIAAECIAAECIAAAKSKQLARR
jgi:hypothetical protein